MNTPSSLTRKTLVPITLRVAAVVLLSAGLSYLHGVSVLQAQVKQELQKYITERGQRESDRFRLAKSNLTLVQQRFLLELKQPVLPNLDQEFNRVFLPWNDRTLRNFPQNRPPSEFDTLSYPTASIGRTEQGDKTPITPELQHRVMTAYHLVGDFGAAWTKQFADLYYLSPENVNINYWHGVPLTLTSPPDLYNPKEEYFYTADPQNNPGRNTAWTGVYLDPSVNIWMVSAILPVYEGDRFLGVFGHDIVLTELIDKTVNDRLPGTTNMLFRADGRLVAHPDYMKEIQAAQGQLAIDQAADPHLQRIFQRVKNAADSTAVIDNPQDDEFIAVTQLPGPDWYFVKIYPKSLLAGTAWSSAQFVLWSGLVALIIEITLISGVLRRQIAAPLKKLTEASQKLTSGDFAIQLDASRDDELGHLAGAFNTMAGQLKASFDQIEDANAALETQVTELQVTLQTLHQTQSQMVQSEKMSALGNLVAGVAHEINNPIGFLSGSITNAQDFVQDLLAHLNLYQTQAAIPVIQDHAEEIDLEFLSQDLPKLLHSMAGATYRIKDISNSLRTFSRADTECKISADFQEGLDSTLLILKYRLKANEQRPEIEVVRDYGNVPAIDCFPGQLNQVFMNILANAIDALEEAAQPFSFAQLKEQPQKITIQTRMIAASNQVQIRIQDNGKGMTADVKARIFDHLFTTKGVGKGTGLGLAIAQQIIVEKHGGTIEVNSELNQGTEFVIHLPL